MTHLEKSRGGLDLSLGIYLREIRGDALLTAEQEAALARAIGRGDEQARSRMIRSNLRLVVTIAREYLGCGMSLDDLVGEGNLGLIRATQEFDPGVGVRFSTYAAYWIRQAIRQALTNTQATIRLPAHMVGLLGRWRKAERGLQRALGRPPQFEEVAGELGLTEAQAEMVRSALRTRKVHAEFPDAREPAPRHEAGTDERDAPGRELERREEVELLLSRLEGLDPRERRVLELRYGLGGGPAMTLKQIGEELHVTREWVRKLEIKAMRHIAEAMREVRVHAGHEEPYPLARTA